MSGPLPDPNARRRNAPTIPTTKLPASGRKGRPPNPPYKLGKAGAAWWRWAWALPQAHAWDKGAHYGLGRRAQLEDALAAVSEFDPRSLDQFFEDVELPARDMRELKALLDDLGRLIGELKSLAGGRLAIVKEMRELDRRFGLDPKAIAELRWTFVADEDEPAQKPAGGAGPAKPGGARRGRLSVVA